MYEEYPEYSEKQIEIWRKRLAAYLKPQRLAHCERVAALAFEMAARHGLNPVQARAAGLLHDVARDLPGNADFHLYFAIAASHGIPVGPAERRESFNSSRARGRGAVGRAMGPGRPRVAGRGGWPYHRQPGYGRFYQAYLFGRFGRAGPRMGRAPPSYAA